MRQYLKLQLDCKALYEKMIESDVCGEQARMILPQSMMTEWIWSGSLTFHYQQPHREMSLAFY